MKTNLVLGKLITLILACGTFANPIGSNHDGNVTVNPVVESDDGGGGGGSEMLVVVEVVLNETTSTSATSIVPLSLDKLASNLTSETLATDGLNSSETVLNYFLPEGSALRRMIVPYEQEWKTLMDNVGFPLSSSSGDSRISIFGNNGGDNNNGNTRRLPGSAYQKLPVPGYFSSTQLEQRKPVSQRYNASDTRNGNANANVQFDDESDRTPTVDQYQGEGGGIDGSKTLKETNNPNYDDYSIFDDSPTKQEDYAGGGKWGLDNDLFGTDLDKLDLSKDLIQNPDPFVGP